MDTLKGDIVKEYLDRHPDYPKRTLARMIFDERPDVYDNLEQVRRIIRYYTGALGENHRRGKSDSSRVRPFVSIKDAMSHYAIRSHKIGSTEDYHIQDPGVYGIISDVHLPYHDEDALEAALEHLHNRGIDALIINGDLVDFYQVSRYNKDPRRASLQEEREMVEEFWIFLREIWPSMPIYYKLGNHEARMEDYLFRKGRELVGIPELELDSFLYCKDYHINLVGDKRIIKLGKLNILHGHETGRSFFNPVNAARGLFLRGKANALCGHYHATSNHHEGNLDEKATATWSIGCLCHMRPEYYVTAYTKWNHGFAVAELFEDGSFAVDNLRINKGRVL